MFTGIVEELGVVAAVVPRADAATLTIACEKVLDDVTHGASIAVNGVCLTVTSFSGPGPGSGSGSGPAQGSESGPGRGQGVGQVAATVPGAVSGVSPAPLGRAGAGRSFTVDVMKETLDRTSLGSLTAGDPVNLERPVRLMDRLGGHIVQGHVDGVGTLVERHRGPHWDTVRISLPPGVDRYLVEKGSVAVDGVSLTVVGVTPAAGVTPATGAARATTTPAAARTVTATGVAATGAGTGASRAPTPAPAVTAPAASAGTRGGPASFTVGLIPTTLASTTLGRRAVGDQLNIEVDVLAKYVEKLSHVETPHLETPHLEAPPAEAPELNGSPR